ncbi:two-component system CitB family sensor kinase [Spinactinospora alkalitolerans]|uniref:histidine kinase n=1 Tax=Spinactinospora alkalitolerans TaxID=687207 RepID=A0A852TYP1_9ACTN|nr:sensor histidine kinase [Spinactinospora alkalitolerans]NYE48921.1 two-component system CitB family sensor kinase [Spinactinospora alkalitolerans]
MSAPHPRNRLSLTGYLFIAHVLLLTAALGITGALWIAQHDRDIDRQYTERVLAIARSVAVLPDIRAAFALEDPAAVIDPIADRINTATGAQYIVVADTDGTRHSHVNDALIGRTVSTPPGPAARGQEWTGVQTGTEGRSVRAKVPVFDGSGGVVGYVSVGILEADVDSVAATALPAILGTISAVLVLGAGAAYVLSRRVRAKTHGLEPAEITALLEGREALLYGVREGVLALDAEGRITLVNEPARAMLELTGDREGHRLDELGLDSRLHDVLSGADPGADRIVLVGPRVLVCNRMPVRVRGQDGGAVVTLRDRTELDRLAGELDGARTLTRGLRAQSHEFANRIHTVAGMLELGAYDDARSYLDGLSAAHARTSTGIAERISDPALAALVLAKSAQAAERGAELRLSPLTRIAEPLPTELRSDLLLVVGNLADNALESVAGAGPRGWVELMVLRHPAGEELPHDLVEVRIVDSGPGVDPAMTAEIFAFGFTTKVARDGGSRGLGLALVRQTCESRGGEVWVESPDGSDAPDAAEFSAFTAYLPVVETAAGAGAGAR